MEILGPATAPLRSRCQMLSTLFGSFERYNIKQFEKVILETTQVNALSITTAELQAKKKNRAGCECDIGRGRGLRRFGAENLSFDGLPRRKNDRRTIPKGA